MALCNNIMLLNRSVSEACVGSHNWTDAMLHKPYIKDNNIVDAQSPKVWTGPSLCRVEGGGGSGQQPWSSPGVVSEKFGQWTSAFY